MNVDYPDVVPEAPTVIALRGRDCKWRSGLPFSPNIEQRIVLFARDALSQLCYLGLYEFQVAPRHFPVETLPSRVVHYRQAL